MGYELRIVRTAGDPITLKTWLACIEADPSLTSMAFRENDDSDIEDEELAIWVSTEAGSGALRVPFLFLDGAIVVKNPGDTTTRKMKEIAKRLGAEVIGDDGERY